MRLFSSTKLLITLCSLWLLLFIANNVYPQWQVSYIKSVFIDIQHMKNHVQMFDNFGEYLYILVLLLFIIMICVWTTTVIEYIKTKDATPLKKWSVTIGNSIFLAYFLLFFNWTTLYNSSQLIFDKPSSSVNTDTMTVEQHRKLLTYLYNRINELPYPQQINHDEYNERLKQVYEKFVDGPLPNLKTQKSIFKSFLAMLGISGYYHPFTGESYVNGELNANLRPFIMAHEMAHQIGVASESEANYTAYWICQQSQDSALQYSACFNVLMQCLSYIKSHDSVEFHNCIDTMNLAIQNDIQEIYDYRRRSRSMLSNFSMGFYNWFLENNNRGLGLKAYGRLRKDVYNLEIKKDVRTPEIPTYVINFQ